MSYKYQDLDMSRIIAKVLTLGLLTNVVLPGGLLAICYYYDQNYPRYSEAGDFGNPLFYIFAFMAIAQAGLAIWWRGKKYHQPMIKNEATMEGDLVEGLVNASKPIFRLIASISLYGYIYFALTGRFEECLLFVLMSFIIFQGIRPRYAMMRKVIDRQLELLGKEPKPE